jgi:hypothetical protein
MLWLFGLFLFTLKVTESNSWLHQKRSDILVLTVAKMATRTRANVLYRTRANIDEYRTRANVFISDQGQRFWIFWNIQTYWTRANTQNENIGLGPTLWPRGWEFKTGMSEGGRQGGQLPPRFWPHLYCLPPPRFLAPHITCPPQIFGPCDMPARYVHTYVYLILKTDGI